MTSIDALIIRAKRLHGVNDDALEAEWKNMLDREVEELLADLEDQIERVTPEEREAEQQNPISLSPEDLEELDGWIDRAVVEAKQLYFANARKKRKRR